MTGAFKALLDSDMSVFHNPAEMASMVSIRYCGKEYAAPAVIDRTAAKERKKPGEDHAEGLHRAECLVHIAMRDLGFAPKKGRRIEIEDGGAAGEYLIAEADVEDGEIILELEAVEE